VAVDEDRRRLLGAVRGAELAERQMPLADYMTRLYAAIFAEHRAIDRDVLASLAPDRPLAWALVEQTLDRNGRVRLDFAPPAAELNLAEAQQRARQRLIEQAVGQLRTLRPSN
jgi:hypothetical protein